MWVACRLPRNGDKELPMRTETGPVRAMVRRCHAYPLHQPSAGERPRCRSQTQRSSHRLPHRIDGRTAVRVGHRLRAQFLVDGGTGWPSCAYSAGYKPVASARDSKPDESAIRPIAASRQLFPVTCCFAGIGLCWPLAAPGPIREKKAAHSIGLGPPPGRSSFRL